MANMHVHPHSGAVVFHRTPQEKEASRAQRQAQKELKEIKNMKEELSAKLKEVDEVLSKLKGN